MDLTTRLLRYAATLRFELVTADKARRKPFRVFDRYENRELASFATKEAALAFRESWINQYVSGSTDALFAGETLPELSNG